MSHGTGPREHATTDNGVAGPVLLARPDPAVSPAAAAAFTPNCSEEVCGSPTAGFHGPPALWEGGFAPPLLVNAFGGMNLGLSSILHDSPIARGVSPRGGVPPHAETPRAILGQRM